MPDEPATMYTAIGLAIALPASKRTVHTRPRRGDDTTGLNASTRRECSRDQTEPPPDPLDS